MFINAILYEILEENHPTKFGKGCASHVLNLLLKDIGKLDDIPDNSQKALSVIKFVNGHTRVHALFNEIRSKTYVQSLQMPVATLWHSFFDYTKRLYAARLIISYLFKKMRLLSRKISSFWRNWNKILTTLEYPLTILTRFQANDCLLDEVYFKLLLLLQFYEENDTRIIEKNLLLDSVNKCWNFLNTEAHEFAFILSPCNQAFSDPKNSVLECNLSNFFCSKEILKVLYYFFD